MSFATDAWKKHVQHVELSAAAGKVSIEGLKKASLGLRTEHELLSFAAKANNAVFKLSQDRDAQSYLNIIGKLKSKDHDAQAIALEMEKRFDKLYGQ